MGIIINNLLYISFLCFYILSRTIIKWNLNFDENIEIITGHTEFITCVAIAPNTNILATGAEDKY